MKINPRAVAGLCCFIFSTIPLFCESKMEVSIKPHEGLDSKEIVFYSKNMTEGMSVFLYQEIQAADKIMKLFASKEKLSEGDYYITIYEDDVMTNRYKIGNPQNMYDEINDKLYKSAIYPYLSSLYIEYLQERITFLEEQINQ